MEISEEIDNISDDTNNHKPDPPIRPEHPFLVRMRCRETRFLTNHEFLIRKEIIGRHSGWYPSELKIEVNIPIEKTDLHAPFVGFKNVVIPYYLML